MGKNNSSEVEIVGNNQIISNELVSVDNNSKEDKNKYYKILELEPGASEDEIKKAFEKTFIKASS